MTLDPSLPAYSGQRFKAILKLALPIIAGLGSQNLMQLIDTMMVGHLDTASLAAVGLCSMVIWMVASLFQGVSHAVQAMTARRLGEGAQTRLHEALVNAIYLTLMTGVPYTFLLFFLDAPLMRMLDNDPQVQSIGIAYLDIRLWSVVFIGFNFCFRGFFNGRRASHLFMQTLFIMHPVNILLNYLLIFGNFGMPQMGAAGAALGTTIATFLGSLNYLRLLWQHQNPGFSLRPRSVTRAILSRLLQLAAPNCLQYFAMALGFLMFYVIAAQINTASLAGANVLINLARTCFILAMGMGMATLTLVGNALGEGRPDEARKWVHAVLFLACGAITALGLTFSVFPSFWLHLFGLDAEVLAVAQPALIILGLFQGYDAAGIILSYAHMGGGATRRVMLISVINQWLLFLPGCWLWINYFDGQLMHLWIAMAIYRFLLLVSYVVSLREGSWLTIKV